MNKHKHQPDPKAITWTDVANHVDHAGDQLDEDLLAR